MARPAQLEMPEQGQKSLLDDFLAVLNDQEPKRQQVAKQALAQLIK
jgi:hypothetical protein